MDKDFFRGTEIADFAEKLSDKIKEFISKDIPTTINQVRKSIWESIKNQGINNLSEKLLISFAYNEEKEFEMGALADINDCIIPLDYRDNESKESKDMRTNDRDKEINDKLKLLYEEIKKNTTYIYVPKDIEPEEFVKFETKEIQRLIDSNLIDEVQKILPDEKIRSFSKKLHEYIDNISNTLPNYNLTTASGRQQNLKPREIYNLIVDSYFSVRTLCLTKQNGRSIPLAKLSSGEKQQAIIDFIHGVVTKYRNKDKQQQNKNNNLIIAIDEPESALHISLCYEQFHKLFEISNNCEQVLFTTHWYGFIPTITKGTIINIYKKEEEEKHQGLLLDIARYREEIKHTQTSLDFSKKTVSIPIDILLKGTNDLIQSLISSVINDNFYNWLICEGSSDKIYLEEYLSKLITNNRLRIIPVGGLKEVRKIYNHLTLAFEELKDSIKGKVFLLIDTDEQFVDFDTKPYKNLLFKRLVNMNEKRDTDLVDNQCNIKTKTDIEDALNGKLFNRTLLTFTNNYPDLGTIVSQEDKEEISSFYAMNLRPTETQQLDSFFSDHNNKNKVLFAKKYVQLLREEIYKAPTWIDEIKRFFMS